MAVGRERLLEVEWEEGSRGGGRGLTTPEGMAILGGASDGDGPLLSGSGSLSWTDSCSSAI